MPKFLLFSDIHVHPHKKSQDRLRDCLKVLDWVFETAIKKTVDFVLFGGDLLHDRQKIDTLTYVETYKILEKYQNNKFSTYLLVGNHDMWLANDCEVASVMPFRALKNFEVVAEPKNIQLGGAEWFFLPYTHNPIEDLARCSTDVAKTYLLGHLSIDGAKLNSTGSIADVVIEHDGDMIKIDRSLFIKFRKSFFGHYHSYQKLTENVMYIGSPLQLSFGEANDKKHIIILDTDTDNLEYIENTFSPKHLYIKQDELEKYTKEDLEGNFVTILSDNSDDREVKKDMALLTESGASTVQVKKLNKEIDQHAISDAKSLLENENTLLQKYVEQIPDLKLDKDLLLNLGQKIMHFKSEE